jgi:hypothetical protein
MNSIKVIEQNSNVSKVREYDSAWMETGVCLRNILNLADVHSIIESMKQCVSEYFTNVEDQKYIANVVYFSIAPFIYSNKQGHPISTAFRDVINRYLFVNGGVNMDYFRMGVVACYNVLYNQTQFKEDYFLKEEFTASKFIKKANGNDIEAFYTLVWDKYLALHMGSNFIRFLQYDMENNKQVFKFFYDFERNMTPLFQGLHKAMQKKYPGEQRFARYNGILKATTTSQGRGFQLYVRLSEGLFNRLLIFNNVAVSSIGLEVLGVGPVTQQQEVLQEEPTALDLLTDTLLADTVSHSNALDDPLPTNTKRSARDILGERQSASDKRQKATGRIYGPPQPPPPSRFSGIRYPLGTAEKATGLPSPIYNDDDYLLERYESAEKGLGFEQDLLDGNRQSVLYKRQLLFEKARELLQQQPQPQPQPQPPPTDEFDLEKSLSDGMTELESAKNGPLDDENFL